MNQIEEKFIDNYLYIKILIGQNIMDYLKKIYFV